MTIPAAAMAPGAEALLGDPGREHGFEAGGAGDRMPPGPDLAFLAAGTNAVGLGRCSDDELIGVMRAARRLASWSAALELASAGELTSRRLEQQAAGDAHAAEHVDSEIAVALTLTMWSAGRLMDLSMALQRLPGTARALAAGAIDLPRAAVIANEVTGLSDDQAAAVEQHILARAPGQTTGQLRAAARRAVIAADPGAARTRREQAEREARVERWDEQAGTAALAGRDLPPAGVLAADQHLSALARSLKVAGLAGTAGQLRARVFLALLSGQPVNSLLPPGEEAPPAAPEDPRGLAPGTTRDPRDTPSGTARDTPPEAACSQAGHGGWAPGTGRLPDRGPGWPDMPVAGTVNLTVPLRTWMGLCDLPGEVAGLGPLGADDARALAGAMAAHPQTTWCLTVTGGKGQAVAHGCARPARGRRGPPGKGGGPPAGGGARDAGHPAPAIAAWVAGIPVQWLESAGCRHLRESAAYRPPPSLQHLIRVRHQACAFPGCRRPAGRCDLDHTTPHHQGGRTCECNLAPLCRRHHEAKQAPGWHLAQLRPGVLVWEAPSGRTRTLTSTEYPA